MKQFVDYLDGRHLLYYMESDKCVYGSHEFETRSIPTFEVYGIPKPIDVRKLYPDMEFPKSLYQKHISKINYILDTYQDYLDFKENFPNYKCMTWGGKVKDLFGDVTLIVDKAKSIEVLANYLNIEKEDIIAFGDAEVDIPMFKASGISVAMASGEQRAKKEASYITDSVENDGIEKALKHFEII